MALISKISVITNVHVLKTGMMLGKGHCVSLPHPMTIAKQLPLLPENLNLIVLRKKDTNNPHRLESRHLTLH